MSEFENVNALDQETIAFLRGQMENQKKEQTRKARLNAMLNESENKDVNKILYEQGGLKDIIDRDPEILDSEASIRLALQTASGNYKNILAQNDQKKKQEEDQRKTQTNNPNAPLKQQNVGMPEQVQEKNPSKWTDLSVDELTEIFKQDPRYAGKAKEWAWTAFGARNEVTKTYYNN